MNYKKASRLKVRFQTTKGLLSTEQLCDLNLNDLDKLAVQLEEACKNTNRSFLNKKTTEDEIAKLKFDIVMDILETKITELETLQKEHESKLYDQKIMQLIQTKKDEQLSKLSIEDLEKMLNNRK